MRKSAPIEITPEAAELGREAVAAMNLPAEPVLDAGRRAAVLETAVRRRGDRRWRLAGGIGIAASALLMAYTVVSLPSMSRARGRVETVFAEYKTAEAGNGGLSRTAAASYSDGAVNMVFMDAAAAPAAGEVMLGSAVERAAGGALRGGRASGVRKQAVPAPPAAPAGGKPESVLLMANSSGAATGSGAMMKTSGYNGAAADGFAPDYAAAEAFEEVWERETEESAYLPESRILIRASEAPGTDAVPVEETTPKKCAARFAADDDGFTDPAVEPFSTFSSDSDRAGFEAAAELIRQGRRPEPETVRIEQFVNAPVYRDYPAPEGDAALRPSLRLAGHPFRGDLLVLRASIQAAGAGDGGGSFAGDGVDYLVLADVSGSMAIGGAAAGAESFPGALASHLEPADTMDIRYVGGGAGDINDEIAEFISVRRGRNSARGQVAILVTDLRSVPEERMAEKMLNMLREARNCNLRFNVVAFGGSARSGINASGRTSDRWGEDLAEAGGGVYLRAETPEEAAELLDRDFESSFRIVADDVKIQLEFDPARVAAYRLAGYERRRMDAVDFRNDSVRAAGLPSGRQVTAIYELRMHPGAESGRVADMTVRSREPGGVGFVEANCRIDLSERVDFADAGDDFRLAFALAEWAVGMRYPERDDRIGIDAVIGLVPSGAEYRMFRELMQLSR